MMLADHIGPAPSLQVQQLGLQPQSRIVELPGAFVEVRIEQSEHEGIECLDIPLPIHVGLAQSERAVRDHARMEVVIVDLDIPRRIAADLNSTVGKEGCDTAFDAGARHVGLFIDAGLFG